MKLNVGVFCVKIKSKTGHLAPYQILPNLDISTSGRNSFPLLPPSGSCGAQDFCAMLCSRAFANTANAYKESTHRVMSLSGLLAVLSWYGLTWLRCYYAKARPTNVSFPFSTRL